MSEMFTFIKRRFSSNDLTAEGQDNSNVNNFNRNQQGTPFNRNQSVSQSNTQSSQRYNANVHRTTELSHTAAMTASKNQNFNLESNADVNHGTKKVYPSAPSSPSRSLGSFSTNVGQQQSQMGIGGQSNNYFAGSMSQLTKGIFSAASNAASTVRDKTAIVTGYKSKILLVIDEPFTDWAKIFRGRKIADDFDIRVEQSQFKEITLSVNSEQGCICTLHNYANKQQRSFRPDFVLIRQHCSDINNDWSNIITGLAMGQVYSLNQLSTVLHMRNNGWLYAHLLQIRNRLGRDEFPLISQTYYSSQKEMNTVPSLPCVVKIGEGHYGDAKMLVENTSIFQDLVSMATMTEKFVTVENYIDAKCDFVVQRIGQNYRGFMRKSISGSWKANSGSSLIEKMQVTDRLKLWIDEVTKIFNGLEVCSINGVITKSGDYVILGASGLDTQLIGESQEEDKRIIADMVVNKWNSILSKTRSSYIPQTMPRSPSSSVMEKTNQQLASVNSLQSSIGKDSSQLSSSVVGQKPLPSVPMTSGSMPPPPPPAPINLNMNSGSTVQQGSLSGSQTGQVQTATTTGYTSSLFSKNRTISVDSQSYKSDNSSSNSFHTTSKDMMITSMTSGGSQPPSSSIFSKSQQQGPPPAPPPPLPQQQQQQQRPLTTKSLFNQNNEMNAPSGGPALSTRPQASTSTGGDNPDEAEDTMKNLRKTFAGIFGDM